MSGWSGPCTRSANLQRAAKERLGLRQLPLDPVEYGQVVEAGGGVGVVRTQHTLPNLQRAAIERLGLRQLPLGIVEYGQVVEAEGGVGVVRTQHTLPNLQARR